MKIGTIDLGDKPLFLAPMEDVTDPSFRHICKQYGADMVYTEFVSSEALIRDVKKTLKKLEIDDAERPIGIQLYGHITESMAEAAVIAEKANPDVIDINFGCPVKKIATRGAGAGLLNNLPKLYEITNAVVKATKKPVTIKTRLGWDNNSKPIIEIAERVQDLGVQAITIHGRTRAQLYTGKADWALIGEIKNNPRIKIPVIGNGDITSAEGAKEAFEKFGVDGIMIGRGAIGKPWLFASIKHFLKTGKQLPEPSVQEKVKLAKIHLQQSLQWKGEPRGIYEMRRHLINYFKGLPYFKDIRLKMVTTLNVDELMLLLDEINTKYPA